MFHWGKARKRAASQPVNDAAGPMRPRETLGNETSGSNSDSSAPTRDSNEIEITEEFARALAILGNGGHMFLTGKAGTGKSTLIRHFMATTSRKVVVAAPTGIAALSVQGYTLHRLFGFRPTTTLDEVRAGRYQPGKLTKVLKSLDTLIIDEASMVRADIFDMMSTALQRFGPSPGEPFGGVQLVLVGDLYQLPPVVPDRMASYFASVYDTPYFFSAQHFSRETFPTVALTRIFRQAGDPELTGILNALREGLLLKDAQAALNKRTAPDFTPPPDEFWLTLAPTNRIVTARNRRRLEELPGDEVISTAFTSGDIDGFDHPVEESLHFKIGAQIMLLTNDPADRWVNGSIGKVVSITRSTEGGTDVASVTVQLSNEFTVEIEPHTWEVTRPVVDGGSLRHEVIGTFTQLPFKLAWAITIHKSQGQTLDRLIVDLTGGVFAFGQVYVALSRCTSLKGLVLTRPVLTKDLKTDRRILRYLRQSTDAGKGHRQCAIAMLTVGNEGRMSRPRPVEIGIAFDDGSAISTLINPQRDLAEAKSDFAIQAQDILLAPTLAEAWATIAPALEDSIPVGVGTDEALGLIDFELKRLGVVTPLPLGVDLPAANLNPSDRADLSSPRAIVQARAALRLAHASRSRNRSGSPFEPLSDSDLPAGLLLSRDPDSHLPSSELTPALTSLFEASRVMSSVILGGSTAESFLDRVEDPSASALRPIIQSRLAAAVRNSAGLPPTLRTRISELEKIFDIDIWGTACDAEKDGADIQSLRTIDEVLAPESRVCFTGSVLDPQGRPVTKSELEDLVLSLGMDWVANVSKTRCDVLIVAELGTQSGKARKAKEYGKPIFSADDFYTWIARQ